MCRNSRWKYGFLFGFLTSTSALSILGDLGEFEEATVKMGIEFSASPWGSSDHYLYLYRNGAVVSYLLAQNTNGVIQQVKEYNLAEVSIGNLRSWANLPV